MSFFVRKINSCTSTQKIVKFAKWNYFGLFQKRVKKMLDLKAAIKKAETKCGKKVATARDCGDKWIFTFDESEGKKSTAPMFVFKENDRSEYFFIDDSENALHGGKSVELPVRED